MLLLRGGTNKTLILAEYPVQEIFELIDRAPGRVEFQTEIGSFTIQVGSNSISRSLQVHRKFGRCMDPHCTIKIDKACLVAEFPNAGHPFIRFYGISPFNGQLVEMTVDHILSRKNGGTNEMGNLQTLCRPCNEIKGIREKRQVQKELSAKEGLAMLRTACKTRWELIGTDKQ